MTTKDPKPDLAALVQAGEQQTEAEQICADIYMVKDISNLYLVKTDEGEVLINAGFMGSAERNKKLLAPLRSGALHAIMLTQAHADHFGGVPLLREAQTRLCAQQDFVDTANFFKALMPYLGRRSGKLWSGTIKRRGDPVPEIQPDITFRDHLKLSFGGKRFELISTPGGEAPDSMVVWLPDDKTVFTGNLFGPVFMSVPNLNTVRGDKPRSVNRFLSSLDTVRKLGVDCLITGHGEPIRGEKHIQACLDKLHDAVAFIRDETIAGMNAGKDVHTLMCETKLPAHLQLGEHHGKVSWAVKSIWHEFSGWFMYDSTTALFGIPRESIHADLVQLAGGAHALATRARQKLENAQPLEALHLLDIALDTEPDSPEAKEVKKAVLEQLLEASGGENLSEVMWLKSELSLLCQA